MDKLLGSVSSSLNIIETFHGGTHNGTWMCYGYYDHINNLWLM